MAFAGLKKDKDRCVDCLLLEGAAAHTQIQEQPHYVRQSPDSNSYPTTAYKSLFQLVEGCYRIDAHIAISTYPKSMVSPIIRFLFRSTE